MAAGAIGSWQALCANAGAAESPTNAATNPNVFKIIDSFLPWILRPLANRADTSISNAAEERQSSRRLLRKTAIGGQGVIFHLPLHALERQAAADHLLEDLFGFFLIFVFAAVATPSQDPFSMIFMAVISDQ
jgi:hypothetical protein